MNLTTEVVYKRGQDYRFVCYDQGHACQSYRVRFLCGRPGKQLRVGTAGLPGPVPAAGGCSSPVWVAGSTVSKRLSDTELPPSRRWRALHDTGAAGGCWELAGPSAAPCWPSAFPEGEGPGPRKPGCRGQSPPSRSPPCRDTAPRPLGAVVSNLVPEMLVRGRKWSGRCVRGGSWPWAEGTRWGRERPTATARTSERSYICFTSRAKWVW